MDRAARPLEPDLPGAALPAAIERLLARVRSAIRRQRAARGAWRSGFWAAVIATGVLAAKGAFDDDALPLILALAIAALGIAAGAIAGARRRVPPLLTARLADRAFGLQDRIATVLELAKSGTPLADVLLADALAQVDALERAGPTRPALIERKRTAEARLFPLALLIALLLAIAPPLPGPESWLPGLDSGRDERASASLVERLKQLGSDLLQRSALAMPELSPQAAEPARTPPNEAAEFKEKEIARQQADFASFVNKGDERLKLLERSDRLPDLQSDFATSKYRVLLKKSQELSGGKGPNRLSADKLGQILREMERLGRRGGDWSEDVNEGMEALEAGHNEEAMAAMQNALGKMRRAEDRDRAKRLLRGGQEPRPDERDGSRGESGSATGNDPGGRSGYSSAGGQSAKGARTPRLRSTPYDTGIEGQRRGRMPAYDTQTTTRPGALGAQLQYRGEIGQYTRLMEDAMVREQVPRDYHTQIRDYFKSLQD